MPYSAYNSQNTGLNLQAIDWLVRLRSDDMNDAELHAFANWLAEDPLHAEAFSKAENLFDDMTLAARSLSAYSANGNAQTTLNAAPAPKKPAAKRSLHWLAAPLAVAAVWLFVVNAILPGRFHPLDAWLSDYRTEIGELREFELSDGSQILLNTDTAISVNFSTVRREIILRHGQARFTVAKDARRPFIVNSNGLVARALGTVFEVYRAARGEVVVTVRQHAVTASLDSAAAPGSGGIKVNQGQTLRYRPGQPLPQPEPAQAEQDTAWQRRRLSINDRPLSELIEELSRYRSGRIFLTDNALRTLRITGVFSLDNPDGVLDSVCKALALRQTRIGPWWVLLHR